MPTTAEIAAMREWLADCVWADTAPEDFLHPGEITDTEVVAAVASVYQGGVAGFLRNNT